MPRFEYEKPNVPGVLMDELNADGIQPEHLETRDDFIWITVPAILEGQVSSIVEAHDGSAALTQVQWEFARTKRNRLLQESDWTCVTDSQLSEADQASWQTYRQALRDVPQNENDPETITWPDAPSG